jgi:hypothetical protein
MKLSIEFKSVPVKVMNHQNGMDTIQVTGCAFDYKSTELACVLVGPFADIVHVETGVGIVNPHHCHCRMAAIHGFLMSAEKDEDFRKHIESNIEMANQGKTVYRLTEIPQPKYPDQHPASNN